MMELLNKPSAALQTAEETRMISFDPSQQRLFVDESRVIVVNWHRQKGKDFTAAAKAVDHAIRTGQTWYIVSLTQRQADATFEKAKKVAAAFKAMLKLVGEVTYSDVAFVEYDKSIDENFECTARTIHLPGGGRVVSLPGKNPDTLAGLTGNVIFTEFGLFPNGGYEHWRVVFPLSTRGFQVIVISTPRNKKTKFFELCSDPETYSYHFCDIHRSIAEDGFILRDNQGRPCTVEAFKKLYGDDAGWSREYECQFTGDMDALISWAQLLTSQTPDLVVRILRIDGEQASGWDEGFFGAAKDLGGERLEFGWDVARHRHFSSFWGNLSRRDGKKALSFLVLMTGVPFGMQRHIIAAGMDCRGGNVGCGDATGLGMDSNETMVAKYRDRWEAVTFNTKTKSELGSIGRTSFQDGTQLLPKFTRSGEDPALEAECKFIATDLYSIQCQPTGDAADKRLLLSETENELEPNSHCDIAYSGLLAMRAGSLQGGKLGAVPAPLRTKPRGW